VVGARPGDDHHRLARGALSAAVLQAQRLCLGEQEPGGCSIVWHWVVCADTQVRLKYSVLKCSDLV